MNTSTITVADSNAFMADLRGAAYAAKHDPKIIARTKRAEPPIARLTPMGRSAQSAAKEYKGGTGGKTSGDRTNAGF